jgi:MinD superfamily P-loop ATPase
MIISVASGKGGTGKTTVAVNLAFALGKNVRVLDCDVEEPNAHLFLKPHFTHKEIVSMPIPKVDQLKCSFCNQCGELCQYSAITVIGQTVLTFPKLCHGCGGCMAICPEHAITEIGRDIGTIEQCQINGLRLVQGKLNIGEAMAPPVIKRVTALTREDEINIIDAPPGTSCPVISAIKESHFVLLVAEPTPFGLHDLQLTVEVIKSLNIPCGLVINRAGMGNDQVTEYAKKEGIPLLLEIPFSRQIAEICAGGGLFAETLPEWKEKLVALFIQIKTMIH